MKTLARTPVAFSLLLISSAAGQELPRVVVDRDNVEIGESCVLAPGDAPVIDADGNGVVHVVADGVMVTFADGTELNGAAAGTAPDAFSGIGIVVDGRRDVTLRGVRVRGYKVGVMARRADGLVIEDADVSGNFRQHLGSTPEAEDSADWLWPHANDDNEWVTNYGAALAVEASDGVTIRRVRCREGQNGIVLDEVSDSKIYDNDCSFLSGWGLAMWRSSRNVVSRNAFDFCVRGYSHGVYNRGQDSAGILMFEQCHENVIAENSATHGGDGFFGFGGKEALGDVPEEQRRPVEWYRRRGNNDNLLIGNDFSYAAAHGIEMTFSFGNRLHSNRLVENSICAVWGGYSKETLIEENIVAGNGNAGYGLERGGINIEHGRGNTVDRNRFADNACGVHFWWDPDEGLASLPWAKANGTESAGNAVTRNTFERDSVAVHLRKTQDTSIAGNRFNDVGEEVKAEESSVITDVAFPAMIPSRPEYPVFGETRPVGARPALRGRDQIIMGEWGPWDHESPFMRRMSRGPAGHVFELRRVEHPTVEVEAGDAVTVEQDTGSDGAVTVSISATEPGVHSYRLVVRGDGFERSESGTLIVAEWDLTVFPWTVDPRENLAGWKAEARGEKARSVSARGLRLPYRWGGPSELKLSEAVAEAAIGIDRFGTIATTILPLDAGRWRVETLSDDGVRVWVDGAMVIDHWTHHGPTTDVGEFAIDRSGPVEIRVEHFEIDGYAVLELDLAPVE